MLVPISERIPSNEYVSFAHRIIHLGADIYWGHSNHMPQGIEIYKSKIIMYDCGDFIDDYAIDPLYRNDLSSIFLLSLNDKDHIFNNIELVPTRIWEFKANTLSASDQDSTFLINSMVGDCKYLGIECKIENGRIKIKISSQH